MNTLSNSNKDPPAKDRSLIGSKCLSMTLLSYAYTGVIPEKPGLKRKTRITKNLTETPVVEYCGRVRLTD